MTDLRWQLLQGATIITKAAWERIPADLRPELLKVSQEAGLRLRKEIREAEAKDVEAMKKRGLTVVPVSAAQRVEWQKLTESIYPRIRGKVVPAEAFDEAMRYRDEYRKQRGTAAGSDGRGGRGDGRRRPLGAAGSAVGRAMRRLEHGFLVVALLAAAFLPLADTLGRPFGLHVPAGADYLQQVVLWLAFLGGLVATREQTATCPLPPPSSSAREGSAGRVACSPARSRPRRSPS